MKPVTVHVTADDIAFGEQNNNARCAAVLALKAADPEIERVTVTREKIVFSHRGDELRYTITAPRTLTRFVDAFDTTTAKAAVKPVSFTVDPAQAVKVQPVQHALDGADRLKKQAGRPHAPGTRKPLSHRPPVQVADPA